MSTVPVPTATDLPPLTAEERAKLAAYERVIEVGHKTFIEVGLALLEIRANKLYRETHRNFGDYVRERWGISRPRAYQLLAAAKLSTTVDTPPKNEHQARLALARRNTVKEWALANPDHAVDGAGHVQRILLEESPLTVPQVVMRLLKHVPPEHLSLTAIGQGAKPDQALFDLIHTGAEQIAYHSLHQLKRTGNAEVVPDSSPTRYRLVDVKPRP